MGTVAATPIESTLSVVKGEGKGKSGLVPQVLTEAPPLSMAESVTGPPPVLPPVAPLATKGKGKKGNGKGKKGKGVAPSFGGKGKTSKPDYALPVPERLRAPGHQRLQIRDLKPAGEIWKSLDPWDPSNADVLQGTTIDYNALLDQLAPIAQPVAPMVVLNHFLLDNNQMRNLEVIVRGNGLTPELIQRGLTENFDALSPEQASALHWKVSPVLDDVRGILHTVVQRGGVGGLSRAEAVLWALESIPQGPLMAKLVDSHFALPENVSFACTPVYELRALRDELETSRPLRTALQACLIALNVLSQKGNSCMHIRMLTSLSTRKLHANQPSVLTLVARDMQRTHEVRSRLRFMRLFILGKAGVPRGAKKLVWAYLDDLKESPWDVIETLRKCRSSDVAAWKRGLESELWFCLSLKHEFAHPRMEQTSSNSVIGQQLSSLQESIDESLHTMQECRAILPDIAQDLLGFFGHPGRSLEDCTELLDILAHFGNELGRARQVIDQASRCHQNGSWQRGCEWGTWEVVDTTEVVLRNTADPELIRSLKHPNIQLKVQGSTASDKDKDGKTLVATTACEPKLAHLLHGGADGEYRRCEATGKWIPVGMAARIAERDRGARGATAGFFVTY